MSAVCAEIHHGCPSAASAESSHDGMSNWWPRGCCNLQTKDIQGLEANLHNKHPNLLEAVFQTWRDLAGW